jgi:hypothetical protein
MASAARPRLSGSPMIPHWPRILLASLGCAGTVAPLAATEDVWRLWLRSPDGAYNILTAGPTHEECVAELDKLLPGAAPGESLRCLPKTADPRESMDRQRPKGK